MKIPPSLRGDGAKCLGVVLLVLGLGWWFKILGTVAVCFGVVLLFIVAWFFVGYLAVTGRIKPVHDLPDRHLLSDGRHPPEWDALEGHFINVFKAGPDDTYRAIMVRFAVAINAVDAGAQDVPTGLNGVIMRKMLYEHQRRHGSLHAERYDERTVVNGAEVLRKLSDDERTRFLEFCRSLDTPAKVAWPPGHPSAAEMARR